MCDMWIYLPQPVDDSKAILGIGNPQMTVLGMK